MIFYSKSNNPTRDWLIYLLLNDGYIDLLLSY